LFEQQHFYIHQKLDKPISEGFRKKVITIFHYNRYSDIDSIFVKINKII